MKKHLESLPLNFQDVARVVGLELATELSERFGGCTIYVPTEKTMNRHRRNESIKKDYRSGCSYSQIARNYGLTESAIRQIISS